MAGHRRPGPERHAPAPAATRLAPRPAPSRPARPGRPGVPEYNRHYKAAIRDHRVFAVAQRHGKTWETHVDVCTAWSRKNGYERLTDDAAELWGSILAALLHS